MIKLPVVSDVVRTKIARLLCFMGAGAVCAVGIKTWKALERKPMIQKQQQQVSSENQSNLVQKNS